MRIRTDQKYSQRIKKYKNPKNNKQKKQKLSKGYQQENRDFEFKGDFNSLPNPRKRKDFILKTKKRERD